MSSENADNLWHRTCAERVEAPALSGDVQADLVVIGGGFTGCSAALHGAQAGADVCLLEAETIGFGGSGRNVGLVNAGLWLPPDEIGGHLGAEAGDRLIALLAGAPSVVFELIDRHGIACEAVRNGTLHCAHSPAGLKDLYTRHAQLVAAGAPVEMISAEGVAQRTGSATFHGALFDPRAGTIQPLGYVRGLARAAQAAGARLHERTPALEIRREGDLWHVRTPGGEVRARALIQATNAYHTGWPGTAPAYVPVHYFQFATPPLTEVQRAAILPGGEGCWDTALVMSSFRMDGAGRMIIGAMGDLGHPGSAIHAGWARRKLTQLYPALAGVPLQQGWCGRIAMTSDHIPKITQIGPNALAAHGYSGRGIGPGTVFGEGMAESLLTGNPEALPVAPVAEHRESLTRVRQAYFETGATLTHLIKARIGY